MSAQKPVVVVGSINIDLVAVATNIPAAGETVIGSNFQIHPGGKGANQAVAVARLGYPVRLVGRVGSDIFGSQLITHLGDAGVDIEGVATSDCASGVALIAVSSSGENSIVVTPGANSQVTPEDIESKIEIIRSAGIVLAQLEIPVETVDYLASICNRENVPLILDPAPAQQLPTSIFRKLAWFTPNEIEASLYADSNASDAAAPHPDAIAAAILAKGCQGVVLKMGSRGAYLASQEGLGELIPVFSVEAVDSTAAGDAFNGGFAVGLMLGRHPTASAEFAAAVAAISVTRPGAQPSMPTMEEVSRLLDNLKG